MEVKLVFLVDIHIRLVELLCLKVWNGKTTETVLNNCNRTFQGVQRSIVLLVIVK